MEKGYVTPEGLINGIIPKYRVQKMMFEHYQEFIRFVKYEYKNLAEKMSVNPYDVKFTDIQIEFIEHLLDDFIDEVEHDMIGYDDYGDCHDCPFKFDYERRMCKKKSGSD